MRIQRVVALSAILVVTLVALSGCGAGSESSSGSSNDGTYRATELRSGEAVSTESLLGQPALLVSWATWCKECDEELAGLQEFADSDLADGLHIVAVNLDAADVGDQIDAKVERHALSVELWRDKRNGFKRTFGALGVPTTVLLDADGKVVETFPGAIDFTQASVLDAIERVKES